MTDQTGSTVNIVDLTRHFHTGGAEVMAVDGLTLSVAAGSMVAVTGASGSGKSTLLHIIGAIERPDSGEVTVDGTSITKLRRNALTAYRRSVGFVFQRFHLLPALTALDNVIAPVLPYRVDYDKTKRATELLAAVGLAGRENSLPSQLSGGQQQRVAIARALINRPRLLLADEPTGNLDSANGNEILALIQQIRRDHGMTVLIATHEQHVAAACDRTVRLRDGRLVDDIDLTESGDPAATLSRVSTLRL